MKRALFLLVTVIGLTVARPALAKPSIAILGLEVIEESDTPDAKAAAYAEALTEALRQRARVGTGPFTLAAGSDKNLVEMKLLSGCDNEANPCMAAIGGELAADRLLYGHVEKNGANYQISLKLLNVDTKSIERTTSDLVPSAESSNASLTALGKKLYAKITGIANQSTLVIKANVDTGKVFLDDEFKGALIGGTARIEGLAAGDYKLHIEAECYLDHDGKLSVAGGADATEVVELAKNSLADCGRSGSGPGGGIGGGGGDDHRIISGGESHDVRPGGAARGMFWVSGAIAAAGAGVWIYGKYGLIDPSEQTLSGQIGGSDICESPTDAEVVKACDDGQLGQRLTWVGVPVTVVAGTAAAYFFYKGYIASPTPNDRPLNARAPRRRVLVAPTVSATTIGGVVHFEF